MGSEDEKSLASSEWLFGRYEDQCKDRNAGFRQLARHLTCHVHSEEGS